MNNVEIICRQLAGNHPTMSHELVLDTALDIESALRMNGRLAGPANKTPAECYRCGRAMRAKTAAKKHNPDTVVHAEHGLCVECIEEEANAA